MKFILIVSLLGFFSSLSKADVMTDIGHIANSADVSAFLLENNLKAKSVSYYLTAYCAGGPSNFVIHTSQPDKCVWVQVGNCNPQIERSQVSILSTSSNLKCE